MPLSELTIASAGRVRVHGLDVGLDRGLRVASASCGRRAYRSPMPLFASKPTLVERVGVLRQRVACRTRFTATPNMIGSETFIIVALRCSENSTPCAFASAICASMNVASALRLIDAASMISPACSFGLSLSTRVVPSAPTSSMRSVAGVRRSSSSVSLP